MSEDRTRKQVPPTAVSDKVALWVHPKTSMNDVLLSVPRMKILGAIMNGPEYISQIVRDTKLTRAQTLHHLKILEAATLVKAEHQIIADDPYRQGLAGKFYSINKQEYAQALEGLCLLASQLRPSASEPKPLDMQAPSS